MGFPEGVRLKATLPFSKFDRIRLTNVFGKDMAAGILKSDKQVAEICSTLTFWDFGTCHSCRCSSEICDFVAFRARLGVSLPYSLVAATLGLECLEPMCEHLLRTAAGL